eukprot:2163807-Rhodomonas_salina.1
MHGPRGRELCNGAVAQSVQADVFCTQLPEAGGRDDTGQPVQQYTAVEHEVLCPLCPGQTHERGARSPRLDVLSTQLEDHDLGVVCVAD